MIDRAESVGVYTDGESHDVQHILRRSEGGHTGALDIWQACCEAVAIMCVNLQHAFNPEVILLGGGISDAGAALLDPVRAAHRRLTWTLADDDPRIELAELGNTAGARGAAGWFLHLYNSKRLPRLGGVS